MSEKYRNISVKTEFADAIEQFVKTNPHYGYRSIAQFMEDAARKRLEELKALENQLPRFERINSNEEGVKILDRQLHYVVDVFIKPTGIRCAIDETDDCAHVNFVLSLPELQQIIRKKRKEGWRLPDV